MKADTLTLQKALQGERRFVIPVYQRPYVWEQERQWEPLWSDIETTARERRGRTELLHDGLPAHAPEPAGRQGFKRLLGTAETPAVTAGRLYALGGLYWTDQDEFHKLLPDYLADEQTRVPQLFTCAGSEETVAAVAARIEEWLLAEALGL